MERSIYLYLDTNGEVLMDDQFREGYIKWDSLREAWKQIADRCILDNHVIVLTFDSLHPANQCTTCKHYINKGCVADGPQLVMCARW